MPSCIKIIAVSFLFLFLSWKSYSQLESPTGYKDIVAFEDEFIAVGSSGRFDRLNKKGQLLEENTLSAEDLNAALVYGEEVLTAGNKGTLLRINRDGEATEIETGTNQNLLSLALFKENILACGENGTLLISSDVNRWQMVSLPVSETIVSISANSKKCYAVTQKGKTLSSSDGFSWNVFDYNQEYSGFSQSCNFISILATENGLAILGLQANKSPVLLLSQEGKVWTERRFQYKNEKGIWINSTMLPHAIAFDADKDQFVVTGSGGEVVCFPSCSKCTSSYILSDKDFWGVVSKNGRNILVGDDFSTAVIML